MEKGEIAHNEQFLLLPQSFFFTLLEKFLPSSILQFLLGKSFSLEESKICKASRMVGSKVLSSDIVYQLCRSLHID